MLVRDARLLEGKTRPDGVTMTDFFGHEVKAGDNITMGHAVFPPGTVVPPAAHNADEYSYIISGTVKCVCGDETKTLTSGCAGYIPAGEVHSSINDSDSDCVLVWMLIDK